ncbi:MAG TPA: pyridoxamine 5'-phosphate oxidase [Lachnospiraceae bacterium]|nr:pyridoxamine 5'-phosphate oxidase [Lachnospiraceae bacterium]
MGEKLTRETAEIMDERFGCDTLLSLATVEDGIPSVRIVNSFYEERAFYIVTYALSNKMRQIEKNPTVAVCGEWFTAHGIGENLGHVRAEKNEEIMSKLRAVFSEWYDNGHTNEEDPNTCLLRIRLTDGVLFHHGTRYDIDFAAEIQS